MTIAKLEFGIAKSKQKEKNREALQRFLLPLQIVSYDERTAQSYGTVRYELEQQGIVIGAMDLLIASQAICSNVVLVTNNLGEFSRIPNLQVENWISQ